MCIGIPMQVVESGSGFALCEGLGIQREVDTLLTGDQSPGTWLLVFLNSAREVISEQDALTIGNAVQAISLVMGEESARMDQHQLQNSMDSLFADLINREIPKPESLIAQELSQRDKFKTRG